MTAAPGSPLSVEGQFGGRAELGHGNACLVLIVTSPTGVSGSMIMAPVEARTLADSLRRPADHAEAVAEDATNGE